MNIVLLELILVSAVALGIGFWQLYDVNRELRKDSEPDDESDEGPDDERD